MIVECGALTMVVVEMQIAIEVNVVIERYPSYLICLDSQRITAGMGLWPYYRIKCWLVKCGHKIQNLVLFCGLQAWHKETMFRFVKEKRYVFLTMNDLLEPTYSPIILEIWYNKIEVKLLSLHPDDSRWQCHLTSLMLLLHPGIDE